MDKYKISRDKKTLSIGENKISFKDDIGEILPFMNIYLILLKNVEYINKKPAINAAKQPENNVYCIDEKCNILWDISQVMASEPSVRSKEYYTAVNKITDNIFSVTIFTGYKFDIDINTLEIVNKAFTK